MWINGPFRAGEHDKKIFDSVLRQKIPHGKLVVTDRVYGNKANKNEHKKLSLPSLCNSKELANFKARLRCCHETFNSRMKNFRSLCGDYHHARENHVHVFEAVCVCAIYQI